MLHSPDPSAIDPLTIIGPHNSYAMTRSQFIPHISKVLEELGFSVPARTSFIR